MTTNVIVTYGNVYDCENIRKELMESEAGEIFAQEYAEWPNGDFAEVLQYSCAEPPVDPEVVYLPF